MQRFTKRHNLFGEGIADAIVRLVKPIPAIHRNCDVKFEGLQLSQPLSQLKPGIWFLKGDSQNHFSVEIVEVTIPYGQPTEDDVGTLAKRRTEKSDKYASLVDAIKAQMGMTVNLYVIIVSSLGAVPRDTLTAVTSLLRVTEKIADRICKGLAVRAIRGSFCAFHKIEMKVPVRSPIVTGFFITIRKIYK